MVGREGLTPASAATRCRCRRSAQTSPRPARSRLCRSSPPPVSGFEWLRPHLTSLWCLFGALCRSSSPPTLSSTRTESCSCSSPSRHRPFGHRPQPRSQARPLSQKEGSTTSRQKPLGLQLQITLSAFIIERSMFQASSCKRLLHVSANEHAKCIEMHLQVSAAHMWMLRLGEKKHPMLAAEH